MNGPFGDTCDIILQNAPLECLKNYPVIIPSGQVQFNTTDIENLMNYTQSGGILVLNQQHLSQFPTSLIEKVKISNYYNELEYGNGSIIVYGPNFNPNIVGSTIIQELNKKLLPFQIEGDIQYMINRKQSSWILTLMNNEGIRKPFDGPAKIQERKAKDVTIQYYPIEEMGDPVSIQNFRVISPNIALESISSNKWSTLIPPGEIIIIEFEL